MEKTYDAKIFESSIVKSWEKSWVFKPKTWDSWTHINILPPPNANWELHLGHASWLVIMDIAGRFARMNWKETLLLPGKDHAWILTQVVFERKLKEEKQLTKNDLGREDFYKQCYDFCIDKSSVMRSQEKGFWVSCDWDREKFTLDPQISEDVLRTFIKMYEDWIAYKGNRIINYCVHCQTAISDMEVKHEDVESDIWNIKYPLEDWTWDIIVATTRPETMLGDSWVAVNPSDPRYSHLIWKYVILPIIWRKVPIVWDAEVDMEFWSWAVKVTPAHDNVDYKIGKRHWLAEIQVIGTDWLMTENAGSDFRWLTVKEARKLVLEILASLWKLWEIHKHIKPLSTHDRCWEVIELLISEQWWVNVDHEKFSLKKEAISAVKTGKIKIIPRTFEKTFFAWMDNLEDWCISRQIWWGHQIPAWYKNGEIKVQLTNPWDWWKQDEDTFDTWFSSWQWAYTAVESKYFPSDLMVMWRDILFFWACRMIMMSLYSRWQIPFHTLYLTWLIRDRNWQKMSKSKWNGIDPLEMSNKYWTDALRLSLVIGNSPWNDLRLYEEKIKGFRNFVNKLWNASRFVKISVWEQVNHNINLDLLTESDKWILTNIQTLIHELTNDIKNFQYSNAGQKLYDFIWNDFCDWYLELSKWVKQNKDVLLYSLDVLLKLAHPFVPFVTEAINSEIFWTGQLLAIDKWPTVNHKYIFKDSLKNIELFISTVKTIRSLRLEDQKGKIKVRTSNSWIIDAKEEIRRLARAGEIEIGDSVVSSESDKISVVNKDIEVILESSVKSNNKEIEQLNSLISLLEWRLSNEAYINKAPPSLVEDTKNQLREAKEKLSKCN